MVGELCLLAASSSFLINIIFFGWLVTRRTVNRQLRMPRLMVGRKKRWILLKVWLGMTWPRKPFSFLRTWKMSVWFVTAFCTVYRMK